MPDNFTLRTVDMLAIARRIEMRKNQERTGFIGLAIRADERRLVEAAEALAKDIREAYPKAEIG